MIVLAALLCTAVMSVCVWAKEVEPAKEAIPLNIADGDIFIGPKTFYVGTMWVEVVLQETTIMTSNIST